MKRTLLAALVLFFATQAGADWPTVGKILYAESFGTGSTGIQRAIDSCGIGSTTDDQGCIVYLPKGTTTITTGIEIGCEATGDALSSCMQNGVSLRGYGAGFESGSGDKLCGSTLVWGGSNGGTVIQASGSNLSFEDFCIDGNNEAGYGIRTVADNAISAITTHGTMKNLRIEDVLDTTSAATGWALAFDGDSGADDADQNDFWTIHNVSIYNSRHCLRQTSSQSFINTATQFYCSEFTVSPGVLIALGSMRFDGYFMDPAVASAVGFSIGTCAADQVFENGVFEWDQDSGTIFQLTTGGLCAGGSGAGNGNQYSTTIQNNRILLQTDGTPVGHTCIDMDRRTALTVIGNSWFSDNASLTCTFALDNPDATITAQASFIGNRYQFPLAGTQYEPTFTLTSTGGGQMRVFRAERGGYELLGPSIALSISADTNGAFYNADNDQTRDATEGGLGHYTHATDCTALTSGGMGDTCWEQDANAIYVCEPTAGGCDTAGEWILSN